MAPATTSSAEARRLIGSRRRTEAPRRMLSPSPPPKKVKSMEEILAKAHYAVVERGDYGDVGCEQCGSGERAEELLLCDKCDKGFHMKCLRPIVVRVPIGTWLCPKCSGQRRVRSFSQRKIIDFFKIKKPNLPEEKCDSPQDTRKRRRRSASLVLQKKRRRLLPFTPSEDRSQRLSQMGSLAHALTALQMEFSDDLTYMPGMAPRSANQAEFEEGGMQVLSKEDTETLEQCRAMCKRGECPPLVVVYDSCEGFTVEADGQIKDMTFIAEYIGDVDFIRNREHDDCDSMMTLLLATDPSKSLVICPDKRGNIARFINGINNYTLEGRKKQNCKCVRYSVNGECRVFLVATRDIAKGERLYYDYNGYEQEYPTHHFNRIEHFVAEFSRDVNFFFASSQGFYKSRILIMTYTTRSGQIQTQGSQGSETLQITSCYRCFICLVHIDVLCSSYQFDESVDEEVCGSSLWCLYIAWMVYCRVELILIVFEAASILE